ncbi:MAG: carbamoyltransferase HypF [Lachnospiraceae bacterium]|nr:carbamoyltransferase HypF [Lachnospiraceae bacterium]
MREQVTKKIRVYGIVQGVGFRPTADRHARLAGITGTVANRGSFVEITATGTQEKIDLFLHFLREKPPKRAAILKVDVKEAEYEAFSEFSIIESVPEKGEIFVSPDIAVCEDCKAELRDPKDRRYQHPFINCTCCGPRLTILDALPYDRERTSMKEFPMCPSCGEEYTDPESRRYDAQPVCCPKCGPEVYLINGGERRDAAIRKARRLIMEGGILAVKGIGGFHFCCDARNEAAVQLLRERKSRPMKPFAVMMRDEQTVDRECVLGEEEREILTGHQKPILLLRKREETGIAPSVAPDNPTLGVMLPYAPVQLLLFDYDDGLEMTDCFVMTSANVSGAPIVRSDEDALREIAAMCDDMLSNDRKIRIRADDSVMELIDGRPYMIRRSRGYAPLPYLLSGEYKSRVLAMGGELKNTFCLASRRTFYPSAYIGDLSDLRSVRALEESIVRMETLLEMKPEAVVGDLHPGYHSSMLGKRLAEESGIPYLEVQHHYAHVLSLMAEHDFRGRVIGVSFDGTGYGTDGTIWGGEVLLSDTEKFSREASIVPFLEIGGDAASREGWRIAVSMLYGLEIKTQPGEDSGIPGEAPSGEQRKKARERTLSKAAKLGLGAEQMLRAQFAMYDRKMNAVTSTSCGRLFDAVSAVLGIRTVSTFEGEASTALMFRAEAAKERGLSAKHLHEKYEGLLEESGPAGRISGADAEQKGADTYLRTDLLFRLIAEERLEWLSDCGQAGGRREERKLPEASREQNPYGAADDNACVLALFFHEALARETVRAVLQIREQTDVSAAGLTGGVFQNRILMKETKRLLEEKGMQVLTHSLVPPNDGGICLGQALYGAERMRERSV